MRISFFLFCLLIFTRLAPAAALPAITTSPTNQVVVPGSNAVFSVIASGATAYQWRFNGTNIAGGTSSSLVVANAQTNNVGYYMVVAKNAVGWVPSQLAYLTVASSPGLVPFSNAGIPSAQAVYQVGPDSNGPITNGTAVVLAGPALDELMPVAIPHPLSNGYFGPAGSSHFATNVAPGQLTYYRVDLAYTVPGFNNFTQPSTVLLFVAGSLASPTNLLFPNWIEWPDPDWNYHFSTNQLRVPGESFTLTSDGLGYTDLAFPKYQWRKDGMPLGSLQQFEQPIYAPIEYATDGLFTKTNVVPEDAGVYDVLVSGNYLFITPKIMLSVQITNGQGNLHFQGSTGSNLVFSLEGAPTRSYIVQWSSNLTAWNTLLTLTNATGTVTFTNAVAAGGQRFFRTVLVP